MIYLRNRFVLLHCLTLGLPDDQRDGFHNTQIHAGIAELFEEDIFKNRTRSGLRRKHFTDEPDDLSVFLLGEGKANRINNKDGFYIHAHMAFGGDAFLRVFSYQHVAERLYPGKVFKTCFCDFTKLLLFSVFLSFFDILCCRHSKNYG